MRIRNNLAILAMALCVISVDTRGGSAQSGAETNPIKIVSSQAAGGGIDVLLRVVAQKLQERTGQATVVDPRPGASGILAGSACAKAPPDGTTICLLMTPQLLLSSVLYTKPPFDAMNDLVPITTLVVAPSAFAVHTSVPVTSFKEFLVYSKQNKGKLNYVGLGRTNPTAITVEWMKKEFDVDWTNISYRGAGDGLQGFARGESQVLYVGALNVIPFVQNGTGRALAVPGPVRLAQLPDVPTMQELGLPETGVIPTAYGVFAPAGTSAEAVARLRREFSEIIRSPELKGRLETSALLPGGEDGEQFAAYLAAERKRIEDIAKALQLPKVD